MTLAIVLGCAGLAQATHVERVVVRDNYGRARVVERVVDDHVVVERVVRRPVRVVERVVDPHRVVVRERVVVRRPAFRFFFGF